MEHAVGTAGGAHRHRHVPRRLVAGDVSHLRPAGRHGERCRCVSAPPARWCRSTRRAAARRSAHTNIAALERLRCWLGQPDERLGDGLALALRGHPRQILAPGGGQLHRFAPAVIEAGSLRPAEGHLGGAQHQRHRDDGGEECEAAGKSHVWRISHPPLQRGQRQGIRVGPSLRRGHGACRCRRKRAVSAKSVHGQILESRGTRTQARHSVRAGTPS